MNHTQTISANIESPIASVSLKVLDDDYSNTSACDRCVASGGGCCTGSGSGIFVTLHDVLRIKERTQLPLDKIAVFKEIDSKEWLSTIEEQDPFFFEAVRNGKVLQLIRKNENCQFLVDKEGCQVFENRPAVCRMFPFSFDFTEGGEIRLLVPKATKRSDEDCTILEENYYRSKGANLKAMNTTKEKMLGLIKGHVFELQMYKLYADDLVAGLSFEEIVSKYGINLKEQEKI